MEIILQNLQEKIEVNSSLQNRVRDAVERTLAKHDLTPCEVSVVFCDDQKIRQLNKQFRGIDEPTDVLSFPMDNKILGDVVISLERASRQAEEYGHSFTREVCFLTVHGILHLIGYDHGEDEGRRKMREMEEEILAELGLKRDES